MRTILIVLFFFGIGSAYLPKPDMFSLLKGTWQYIGASFFVYGTPDTVSYNSKIEFTDTLTGDSIRYLTYYNDSLIDTITVPFRLEKTYMREDTQWVLRIIIASTDTTLRPLTGGSTFIDSISNTELFLIMDAKDANGYVFKRSAVSTEKNTSTQTLPLLLYPNPLQLPSSIQIDCDRPILSMRVFNIQGAQVSFINAPKNRFMLDIRNLSPGIYLVKAKTARHIYSKKLVILE